MEPYGHYPREGASKENVDVGGLVDVSTLAGSAVRTQVALVDTTGIETSMTALIYVSSSVDLRLGETVVSPSVAHALAGTAILEEAPNSPEGRMFYKVTGLLPPEGNSVKRAESLTTLPPRPSSTRATGLALTEGEEHANQKKDDSIAELPVQPPPPLAPIDVEPDDIDLLRR